MTDSALASYYSKACLDILQRQPQPTSEDGCPQLHILEQPVSKFRFRYRSEMQGAHGSLLGQGETSTKKSYPTVVLQNYTGKATVRCQLYTADPPFKPHMHQLISKKNSKEVYDHEIEVSEMNGYRAEFKGLGIVHLSKRDLKDLVCKKVNMYLERLKREDAVAHLGEEDLKRAIERKRAEIEKKTAEEAEKMDPNKVRLLFEAVCRDHSGKVIPICHALSDPIQNMKSAETGELKICAIDRVAGSCRGDDEIFILVEKVCKKNIKIRFYELDSNNKEVWEDYGKFEDHNVHHQYAIVFRTPRYRSLDITANVTVNIELIRPKDQARSESRAFTYKPLRRMANKRQGQPVTLHGCEEPKRSRSFGALTKDDDPLLSGSETSSTNSLRIPSDILREALKTLDDPHENPKDFEEFLDFCQSPELVGVYFGNISSDDQVPDVQGKNQHSLMEPTPTSEMDLDLSNCLEEMLTSNNLIEPQMDTRGYVTFNRKPLLHHENVVTDGAIKKFAAMSVKKDQTNSQKDTSSLAKKAYNKLLKSIKSRHPSRLIDIKNTIRAEDQEYGPLHAAILHDQLKEMSDLLSLIIKSNQLELIDSPNERKQTPLLVAVEENKLDFVKLLCMARANLSATDLNDNSALHVAVKNGYHECLKTILDVDLSKYSREELIDKKNDFGETALHIAVRKVDIECVKLLLDAGADVNIKSGKSGFTPLHFAVESNSEGIVNLLLSQDNINPDEVDFNQRKASDLARASQLEIKAILRMSQDIEVDEESEGEGSEESDFESANESEEEVLNNPDSECESVKEKPSRSQVQDSISVIDTKTRDIIIDKLNRGQKWKTLCKVLDCEFLISTICSIPNPSRCLFEFLESQRELSVSEFRDSLQKLNMLEAVSALDKGRK